MDSLPAESIADRAAQADVTFTSLSGPPEVEALVLGEGGIAGATRPGTVLFELSTSARSLALRIHDLFRDKGSTMLNAPARGSLTGEHSGDLTLWISDTRMTFDRNVPLLQTICTPHYTGSIGAGIVTKLAHNMLGYVFLEAQAESFIVGAKAGLDPLNFWQALRLDMVGKQSPPFILTQQCLGHSYAEAASAQRIALKDVRLAVEIATEMGGFMRLGEAKREDMNALVSGGEGEGNSRSSKQLQVERAGMKSRCHATGSRPP